MNGNPWHGLPDLPPFVLPDDKAKVLAFNREEQQKANPNLLNLDIIPAPFAGNPKAPVVLLGNIAGHRGQDPEDYKLTPACADLMRKNLLHIPPSFYPFEQGSDIYPSHKKWWAAKLKHLLDSFGKGRIAECILAPRLFAVEFFPYRSSINSYAHDRLSLPSQTYNRFLVQEAMKREAVIVVRYGLRRWVRAIDLFGNNKMTVC